MSVHSIPQSPMQFGRRDREGGIFFCFDCNFCFAIAMTANLDECHSPVDLYLALFLCELWVTVLLHQPTEEFFQKQQPFTWLPRSLVHKGRKWLKSSPSRGEVNIVATYFFSPPSFPSTIPTFSWGYGGNIFSFRPGLFENVSFSWTRGYHTKLRLISIRDHNFTAKHKYKRASTLLMCAINVMENRRKKVIFFFSKIVCRVGIFEFFFLRLGSGLPSLVPRIDIYR